MIKCAIKCVVSCVFQKPLENMPNPNSLYNSHIYFRSADIENLITWNASFVSTFDYDGDGVEWPKDCNDFIVEFLKTVFPLK